MELCESLYEKQPNEETAMHAMFEREQTREKNLQAAKRFGSSEKKSTRRATEL